MIVFDILLTIPLVVKAFKGTNSKMFHFKLGAYNTIIASAVSCEDTVGESKLSAWWKSS